MPSPIDEIITRYAAELERIYTDRTAGDFTFEGVLSQFLREISEFEDNDMPALG